MQYVLRCDVSLSQLNISMVRHMAFSGVQNCFSSYSDSQNLHINNYNLKEKDQKQLYCNQNESISKTKLFGANFMKIRL